MIKRWFGFEGVVDYHAGWLRVGRHWVGFWHGRPRLVKVISGGGKASTHQNDRFAFGDDDGSESGHTLDTENADRAAQVADVTFLIRIQIEETAGGTNNLEAFLFVQKNGSGGFLQVTTTSTNGIILANDTQGRTDDEATTERLTAGGGAWAAGKYDDGQTTVGCSATALNSTYTEFEFAVQIDSTYASDADYFEFRVEATAAGEDLDSYPTSNYPTATADIADGHDDLVAEYKAFGLTGYAAGLSKIGAYLFNIRHETDLSEYDSTVTDGGDLSQGSPGLAGTDGKMEALIDDNTAIYGAKDVSVSTDDFRCRFYFDPNTITSTIWSSIYLCGLSVTTAPPWWLFRAYFSQNAGGGDYYIHLATWEDDDSSSNTEVLISDDVHWIEVWAEKGADGAGQVRLWIDDSLELTHSGLDNDTIFAAIDEIILGAGSVTGDFDGTIYLDEILANDDGSYIGPVAEAGHADLVADYKSFTLTGQAAGLAAARLLAADQGSFTLAGQAAGLARVFNMLAAQGSFVLTGQAAGLTKTNNPLAAEYKAFTLAGYAAGLAKTFTMLAAQGSFTLAGQAAGLAASRLLTADQGSFTLAGYAAGLARVFNMLAAQGSFTLAGQTAGLGAARLLTADQASFVLTGYAAGLSKIGAYFLLASTKAFTLTGQATGLAASRLLTADQGSFSLVGQAAGLAAARVLLAAQGSFTLAGQDAGLYLEFLQLLIEEDAYIVQTVEQDANIVQAVEGDANIVQVDEQDANLIGGQQ